MTTGNNAVFLAYTPFEKKAELLALDDCQLKELLAHASRRNVREMFKFTLVEIKKAFDYLEFDEEALKPWGNKNKKSTWVKMAIDRLSFSFLFFPHIDKAVDTLSYALGIQNGSLEEDEQAILDALKKAESDEKVQQTIDAVDGAIQTVQATAKKVTKAELKLQRQILLNRLPAEVKWESDFLGEVWMGKEVREFWVAEPYENPVINLATSSGMVIMSNWHSTVENPFMRAAVRAFHDLIAERSEPTLIENRLIALTGLMASNKKRVDWYAQSVEALVMKDGERMKWKQGAEFLYTLQNLDSINFSEGLAYKNAQYYARSFPNAYNYVEGFALANNKLFHHAWVQSKLDLKAVDVTFNEPKIQLFGIVLDIDWVDKSIASRIKDDSISPRFTQSIIEGNFLDDFALLKSGVTSTW